jgi:hypothetical protein
MIIQYEQGCATQPGVPISWLTESATFQKYLRAFAAASANGVADIVRAKTNLVRL